ncbi:hypothetical protein [Streptosporangium jomthongense]|uniref:Uncharacterized protein n=1 Tax=Streptosporangium jomthongense TaxID=1193683 RepID=A0ABV8FDS2_9ACTN
MSTSETLPRANDEADTSVSAPTNTLATALKGRPATRLFAALGVTSA